MKKLLFLIVLMLTGGNFVSCSWDPEWDEMQHFFVRNATADTIYVNYMNSYNSAERFNLALGDKMMIEPYKHLTVDFIPEGAENVYFQIDFWRKATLDKYSKEYLYEHDLCDKRMFVSYKDLEQQNFIITFE